MKLNEEVIFFKYFLTPVASVFQEKRILESMC